MSETVAVNPVATPAPEAEPTATAGIAPEVETSTESPAEQQAAAHEEKPPQKYKLGDEEYDEAALKEFIDVAKKRKDHTAAANKRFEEAAKAHKEAQALQAKYEQSIAAMEKDPFAPLRTKGLTDEQINQIAYARLSEQARLAELQKTDPQRFQAEEEYRQIQAEIAKAKEEKAHYDAWQAEQKSNAERAQHEAFIEEHLPLAVEKAGLKGIPEAGFLTQQFVIAQLQAGGEPDFATAAETVKDFVQQAAKSYVANLPQEALEKEFPGLVKSLREASVNRVAKVPAVKPAPATPKPQVKPDGKFDRTAYLNALKRGEPIPGLVP